MVKPLRYDSGLNLREAEERLDEIKGEFEKVKNKYSGFFSKFKRYIRREDLRTLNECIGVVLLPLKEERAVQKQFRRTLNLEETVYYEIGELKKEILDYLAGFKNTGVTRIKNNKLVTR